MAAADLLICRAGAITISELQALGKPAILIPSPNVAENHQYHNAMELVKAGAAEVIEEKNLTPELLIKTADRLLKNKEKLELYGQNAKKMALINANERIYRTIKNL
jgi:UDP-N-acetylglucosamine--N-acetylmuramyl-(pentapeptide) pyrophosphoryl-undecaprenol N-acetylglucosamine transferase